MNFNEGKLPPQAIDIEKAVLSVLINYGDSIVKVIDILTPNSFYKSEHGVIYQSILQLFNDNKSIDLLTIQDQLRKSGLLDECGGPAYLSELMIFVSGSRSLETHSRITQQKYLARELIRISHETQQCAFDDSLDVHELIDYTATEVYNLQRFSYKTEPELIGDIGGDCIKLIYEIIKSDKSFTGVPSGYKKLDRTIGGWQDGDLIIIAARPSMGKTLLALMLLLFPAKLNIPVALFSIEMGRQKIYNRILSAETGIPTSKLRDGNLTKQQLEDIEKGQAKIEKLPIYVDDPITLSVAELRAKAMRLKKEKNIKLIIVDYLQLMNDERQKNNREREISEISAGLKAIAKELNIPVIALCQLSRKVEERSNKRPLLSDLRESGAIEQNADLVIFIHREDYYSNDEKHKNKIELLIRKHRDGKLGDTNVFRDDDFTHIKDEDIDDFKSSKPKDKQDDLPF